MPYASGRVYHDADSHIMEPSDWLERHIDPEKTVRWLRSVGARHGFEVVPLSPAFRAASDSLDRPLWFGAYGHYGHWNATGHAVAARAMADYFAVTPPAAHRQAR